MSPAHHSTIYQLRPGPLPEVKAGVNPNALPDGTRLVHVEVGDHDSSVRFVGDADQLLELVNRMHGKVYLAITDADPVPVAS